MEFIAFPPPWERHAAPVATWLDSLGSPLGWWGLAALCLGVATWLCRRRQSLAVGLAAAGATALALSVNTVLDDAYIQFRYAAQLAEGHGFVFNPGQRLEGASGGVWVLVLAAARALFALDPGLAGRALGLALVPLTVALAAYTAHRLAPHATATTALAWAAYPTALFYASSGMETLAFAAALWLLAWGGAASSSPAAAAGATLAVALRPEAPLFALAAAPFWRRLPPAGKAAVGAGLATTAGVATTRFLYFGSPVPHSAVVKGVTAAAGVAEGLAYAGRAALEWAPLLLALPALWDKRRGWAPLLLPATLWLGVVALRGGDWMPGSRYLLPVVVPLTLAGALRPTRWRVAVASLAVLQALLRLAPVPSPPFLPAVGDLWRQAAEQRVRCRWWEGVGRWLKEAVPPTTCLATGPAGALPYASGLPTFDLYGLVTPIQRVRGGMTGHLLWGLPEAVAAGCELIYPGEPFPQEEDPRALGAAVHAKAAREPLLAQSYRPVLLRNRSAYHYGVRQDLLWVRSDQPHLAPLRPPSLDKYPPSGLQ